MKRIKFPGFMIMFLLFFLSSCSSVHVQPGSNNDNPGGVKVASLKTVRESQETKLRTITVTGNGEISLPPDVVYINIGVHNENRDVADAVEGNNITSKNVRDALLELGVVEKDIQTQNFGVYQNQKYDSTGQPTEMVYAVDNTLSVAVRDIQKIGKVLGEVTKAGANNIYGIQFDLSDKSKPTSEARILAFRDAQKQAGEMAEAMGVKLGEIQSVVVNYGGFSSSPLYGIGGGEMALKSNVPISGGQIQISASVNMVFAIQ